MRLFFTALKYDYLQRTRSYAFLITLCASLAIAYTFVPEPNASYSTIRISDYVGYYNSAWFGYVTAIMGSVFLSMIGYYLINSGIKRDFDTRIGQIIATTPTSNFKYLLYKMISNFLVLLTITGMVFIMSVILFFLYNDSFALDIMQFLKPYVIVTIPALFFIAAIAVVFEVIFGKYAIIQNIAYFFLFTMLMFKANDVSNQYELDVFGTKIVVNKMEEQVQNILQTNEKTTMNIGYVVRNTNKTRQFEFTGVDFPIVFVASRFGWMFIGVLLIILIATFFHRFDKKLRVSIKKQFTKTEETPKLKEVNLSILIKATTNYNVFPLLKTEFLMLFRKGKKWHWLINLTGMSLLVVLPLKIAHQIVLPILWFLQVGRLSDLTVKEQIHNVHYFAFTSYKPLQRLLISQLTAGIILMLLLALPIIIRQGLLLDITAVIAIALGAVLVISFAAFLGVVSRGKKLFEVLFFMITYIIINGVSCLDYFGGFEHESYYLIQLIIFTCILISGCFLVRKIDIDK